MYIYLCDTGHHDLFQNRIAKNYKSIGSTGSGGAAVSSSTPSSASTFASVIAIAFFSNSPAWCTPLKKHTHSCRRRRRQSTAVRSIRTVSACCFVARQGMMMLARWNVASGAYVKRLSVASLKFGCSIAHAAPMASQYLPCPSLTVPPAYESVSVQ